MLMQEENWSLNTAKDERRPAEHRNQRQYQYLQC